MEPDDAQILILVGSKEGLAHLPWAVCNPQDTVLVPDPGYPVYDSAAQFVGCKVVRFPLQRAKGYLPDFDAIPPAARKSAKLCFLNYPNNPTSAVAGEGFFEAALSALDPGTIVANDAAYADVFFDGVAPRLLCGVPGALERPTVEFFSFSKILNESSCLTGRYITPSFTFSRYS